MINSNFGFTPLKEVWLGDCYPESFYDLRTRSFWDGGWHCFTLDIHRHDTAQDLFTDRGDNGVYWRLK